MFSNWPINQPDCSFSSKLYSPKQPQSNNLACTDGSKIPFFSSISFLQLINTLEDWHSSSLSQAGLYPSQKDSVSYFSFIISQRSGNLNNSDAIFGRGRRRLMEQKLCCFGVMNSCSCLKVQGLQLRRILAVCLRSGSLVQGCLRLFLLICELPKTVQPIQVVAAEYCILSKWRGLPSLMLEDCEHIQFSSYFDVIGSHYRVWGRLREGRMDKSDSVGILESLNSFSLLERSICFAFRVRIDFFVLPDWFLGI